LGPETIPNFGLTDGCTLWREIAPEKETAYLLSSETMKHRLLEARQRQDGISFEEACAKLGI